MKEELINNLDVALDRLRKIWDEIGIIGETRKDRTHVILKISLTLLLSKDSAMCDHGIILYIFLTLKGIHVGGNSLVGRSNDYVKNNVSGRNGTFTQSLGRNGTGRGGTENKANEKRRDLRRRITETLQRTDSTTA